jgi:hypothetical protein
MFVTVDKIAPGQVLESLLELHLAKRAQRATTAEEPDMPSLSLEVTGQAVLHTAPTSPMKKIQESKIDATQPAMAPRATR